MKGLLTYIPRAKAQAVVRVRHLMASSAVKSAIWVLVGSGGHQLVRLAGNLILTRLLFPEIFGIMAIVTAILVGLGQLSDVGLREGVVNSDRINDPKFMRTAWTLQIIRTGIIGVLACIVALPLAKMYDEPLLTPVLIMIALATFATGFKSIALLAYDKRLDLKTQMLTDLGVQLSGLTVTIVYAWISPSIWAMVAGQWFATVMEVSLSYLMFKGHHSKFAWDKSSVSQLFGFGKWIFLSSVISFVSGYGDRLIMGGFLTMAELGKYSVAATWSAIVTLLSVNVSTRLLHPYFRQALDNHSNFSRIHKVRNLLNTGYTLVCVALAIGGEWLIVFLYDDRYIEAGWMLQILALGQISRSLTGTLTPFLFAYGDSFSQMKFSAVSTLLLISFIFMGGWLAGSVGVVAAYAFTGVVAHPVMIAFATKHGFRCLLADSFLILGATTICVVGWWLIEASVLEVLTSVREGAI